MSRKSDAARAARVEAALDAQDERDARVQAHTGRQAAAYVKRHGLEKVVDRMTDAAMARHHEGFNTKGWN